MLTARVVSAQELKSRADFDRALLHAAAELSGQWDELQLELNRKHDQLVAAQQEVARLEKLQQIAEAKHRDHLRRIEQRAYDETITARVAKPNARAWQ